MKRKLWRIAIALCLALVLVLVPVSGVFAATSEPVTVTATPAFIACDNDPATWTLNDIVGAGTAPKGTIAVDIIYYSNPLGDITIPSDPVVTGECRFTLTNTSSITTDMFVIMSDFTGGTDNMTNSDLGTNDTTKFGAYSYCTGMTYSTGKVICKVTGSDATKLDLAPTTNITWGLAVETQSNAWTGGSSSTSTATVSLAPA